MTPKPHKLKLRLRNILSAVIALAVIGLIGYFGTKTYQASHAASSPSIYVSPGSAALTPGSTVSVSIRENSGSEPVNSVQVSLGYDSSTLQFNSIVESNAFPVAAATSTATPGVIRIGRANADNNQTGDQVVATINFKVIGSSGSSLINVDKAYSFLVRSSDSKDILQTVGNGGYTISGPASPAPAQSSASSTAPTPSGSPVPPDGKPVIYLNPPAGSYGTGSTLSLAVRLNSFANSVTTVQSVINYPADKIQYVSVSEGAAFTTQQRTKNNAGSLDIIRGVSGGGSGKSGDNIIVTINFKVLASSGTAVFGIGSGSAVYDASGTGSNILNLTASAGGSYTLGTATTVGSQGSSPSQSQTSILADRVIASASQAMTITAGAGGAAAIGTSANGGVTELKGQVLLAPSGATTDNAGSISKVEYYLNNKLIASQKTAPYTYAFDTKRLRNGSHAMQIKTYYANGTVDTKSEKLLVRNKVTLSYVMRQYVSGMLGLITILAVCIFVIWKLVMPRFVFAHQRPTVQIPDHDIVYGASKPVKTGLVMADPIVVTPTVAPAVSSVETGPKIQVDDVVQITPALPIEVAVSLRSGPAASVVSAAAPTAQAIAKPIVSATDGGLLPPPVPASIISPTLNSGLSDPVESFDGRP